MKLEGETRRQPGRSACLEKPPGMHGGDVRKIGGGQRSRDIAATRQEMVVPGADECSWDPERRER